MTTAPDWARTPARKKPTVVSGNGSASSSSYAEAALAAECQTVAVAVKGSRNNTLNRAAFAIGQLIAVGELDEATARRRLDGAALAAGLEPDEIGATINSGFLAGAAAPRASRDGAETGRRHHSPGPSNGRLPARGRDCDPAEQCETEQTNIAPWPVLSPAAKRGLAGEIAKLATAHSEADPVAVMMTALTAIGALMGRGRFISVGDTHHHARLMVAIVGATSRARKGTSWGPVKRLLTRTQAVIAERSTLPFPLGRTLQITHGPLSSGEGLVSAIRDKIGDDDEEGTDDKRLLVVEGELGAALRAMQRNGNNLSMIMRTAWDGHEIAPLIKNNRMVASDPHVCLVAHITRPELKELLSASDVWGGLANRLLWACVRRGAILPSPRPIQEQDLDRLVLELVRAAIHATEHPCEMRFSNAAADHWANVYPELTQDRPGLLGAATARAEAQTVRLALTYALIDGADRVELHHLEAALAMWRYADDSAAHLFGGAELDPIAEAILAALRQRPHTQTEINNLFSGHESAKSIANVFRDLQDRGVITLTEEKTKGRPRRIWSLVT